MIKNGDIYLPDPKAQSQAWVNSDFPVPELGIIKGSEIYQKAFSNPLKFWAKLAKGLFWFKPFKEVFWHKPPFFKWFVGGKLNITYNALDLNLPKYKDKPALIWEPEPVEEKTRTLNYHDLYREVNKLANALKKLGVKKGDRVGIYLPMLPEVVIAMLACARIGAVHTVVFSAFSPPALMIRLKITGAKVLITADGYYRRGQVINLKANADEGLKETEVRKVIVVKRAGNPVAWNKRRDIWWHDLISGEKDYCRPKIMDAEDLLFILFTSGTTGIPKGCQHVCGGYMTQAYWTGKWIFDWHDGDVFWSTADIGWITGHTYSCYAPLLCGATFMIFEGSLDWPGLDRWCQMIEKRKVTIFYTAPTAIRMFERYSSELVKKYKFKTLRLLGSVGEPIDEAAWTWYFETVGKKRCPIVDTWWQTETGGILISSLPGLGPFKPAFAGLPFPGVRFEILDDAGNLVKKGKPGNLVILPPFAPGLLRGIYKDPKKYQETYWSQYGSEVYFTSDAAFRGEHGMVRILGRVDDVIKVAGHRLTTGELEAAINSHPNITECAVVGISDEIKGEVPVAFVVVRKKKGTAEIMRKEVIGQVRKIIGPIASPKEVYLVNDLPKTRSGKVMRRILKRLLIGEPLGDLSTLANPESVKIVKNVLGNTVSQK